MFFSSVLEKGNDNQGFKGLWRKVRPFDKPEEVGCDLFLVSEL